MALDRMFRIRALEKLILPRIAELLRTIPYVVRILFCDIFWQALNFSLGALGV